MAKEELERRCEVAENESRKLREENNRLRDELRILDLVKGDLQERAQRHSLEDAQMHFKGRVDDPPSKRRREDMTAGDQAQDGPGYHRDCGTEENAARENNGVVEN